ncbi:MAG TPA: hypothetical protein PLX69_22885 [Leptospiraceae bacterium]|nr:hypothetical protein [Leptospiraceae bacterium]
MEKITFKDKLIFFVKYYEIIYNDYWNIPSILEERIYNFRENYNFTSRTFRQVIRDMLDSPIWTKEQIDGLYKIVIWEKSCSFENKMETLSNMPIRKKTLENIENDYQQVKAKHDYYIFGIVGTGKFTTVKNNHDSMVIRKLFSDIYNNSSKDIADYAQTINSFGKQNINGIGIAMLSAMLYSLKPTIFPIVNGAAIKGFNEKIVGELAEFDILSNNKNHYLTNVYTINEFEKYLCLEDNSDKSIIDRILYWNSDIELEDIEELYENKRKISKYILEFDKNEKEFIKIVESYNNELLTLFFIDAIKNDRENGYITV